jgi:hypothetical protein
MLALEIRAIFVFLNDLMALSQTTSIDTGHSLVEVAGTSPATTPRSGSARGHPVVAAPPRYDVEKPKGEPTMGCF